MIGRLLGAALVATPILLGGLFGPAPARAGCSSVNGSALNNLAANETVNCEGSSSDSLAATNDGITLNLLSGLSVGTGANFTTLADSNIINGFDFFVLAGNSAIEAGDANSLHLSSGYLSGGTFGISLQSGSQVWLTDMEIHGTNAAISYNSATNSVIVGSLIESANFGITTGVNSNFTLTDTDFETGATAIEIGNGGTINMTGGSIDSATNGILTGTASSVRLTDVDAVTGAQGINVGNGSEIILRNTKLDATAQGIVGIVGFASLIDSEVTSATSNAIEQNGTTTLTNSVATGVTGFMAHDLNTTANLTLFSSSVNGDTNSALFGNAADTLTLNSGSALNSVAGADGGAGTDDVLLHGSGAEDEIFLNFENLVMDGTDWALAGVSSFTDIDVESGRLRINADIAATNGALVSSTGIIGGNGSLTTPLLDVTGGIAPGNSVGTLNVIGNFAQNGGFMEVEFGNDGIDLLNVTGTATLTGVPTLQVKPLSGAGGASAAFLTAGGGLTGTFGSVDFDGNGGATVIYAANQATLIAAQPTASVAEDAVLLGLGENVLGVVGDEQSLYAGLPDRRVWGTGFGFFSSRDARNGNAAYEAESGGTLFGSDLYVADGWRLGVGAGYGHSAIDVAHNAGDSNLDGAFALAYGGYATQQWFLGGRLMTGWQDVETERAIVGDDGRISATGDSDAWLFGIGLSAGSHLDFDHGWRLTPRVNLDYVQQWHSDARESGADSGEIDLDSYSTASLTASASLRAGQTYEFRDFTLEPFIEFGGAQRIALGDRHVDAAFQDNGDTFDLALEHDSRTVGTLGIGTVARLLNGVDVEIGYEGSFAAELAQHAVLAKLRAEW